MFYNWLNWSFTSLLIIFTLLLLTFILLVYNYHIHHGKKGRLINLIPGPPFYPIVGHVLRYYKYLNSREDMWNILRSLSAEYYPILRIWAFFAPFIYVSHPDDLKIILSNTKCIEKTFLYDVFRPWLGTGIFTNNGEKWHSQKKILLPVFHFNMLQQCTKILIEESQYMIKSLKDANGSVVKDLIPFFSKYTLNTISEAAMGVSLRDLSTSLQQQYHEVLHRLMELLSYRLVRQWLYNDWIFSLTPQGKEQKKLLKILHEFSEQIITKRMLYHERSNGQSLDNNISADNDEHTGASKNRIGLLDILITAFKDGLITYKDIKDEVNTFIFAGHDTITTALGFALALLAEHKDIQNRVRDEIHIALLKNGDKYDMKLLQNLPYLERCIKETLRLYPSATLIGRKITEDLNLQSYLIPAGTNVILDIYAAHRDPHFWPNPEVFDPDRFLSENIRNHHPYSYIPFSAGPRNCMGQKYALLEMKAMIASIIQNFYLEPIGDLKNLQFCFNFVICPVQALRVQFIPIYKTNTDS